MSRYLDTLLALADAAEQRPLTEREAEVLRTQLRALEANRRQVSGLQAALHSARQELDLIAGVVGPLIGGNAKAVKASMAARHI
ncbi:hypothetical protein ACH4A8_38915 [Streptomyces vietnamensis]|uniref:hypothetical protein n=1 Tax=Streptomyces vietnamensis TaxID=362257 RepID=UPI0037963A5C